MKRYAETLFRHWLIAVLPVIVLPMAAYVLLRPAPTAQVVANVWVNQSSIKQLSYADQNATPALNTATGLGQLLQSRSFDLQVAADSPLYWQKFKAKPGGVVTDLTKNLVVSASGPNLVVISYTTGDVPTGAQVVQGILREAPREIQRLNRLQAAKALPSYTRQLNAARARLAQASRRLHDYMNTHNIAQADVGMKSLVDPGLATLYQTVQSTQADVRKLSQQVMATPGSASGIYQVVDQPTGTAYASSKKKMLLNIGIAAIIGLLLSGTFIVAKTALDHSIHYAAEVPELLALPVLAVVPHRPGHAPVSRLHPDSEHKVSRGEMEA